MKIIKIDRAPSTNTWVGTYEDILPETALVYCFSQTAGRGQRGNTWESEPGKNITASLLFHPYNFPASAQFKISEAVALALVDYLKEKGVSAKVKWPNDIYVDDKKICGILVEHVVTGKNITRTIAGFGLNLNQKKFLSKAPNPVSLTQITGKEYDIKQEVSEITELLKKRISDIKNDSLHDEFLSNLWRYDNEYHKFHDKLKNERLLAKIHNVAPDGILTLITDSGEKRDYAFKEIEFILE